MVVERSLAQHSSGHQSSLSQPVRFALGLRESPLGPCKPLRLSRHEPRVAKRRDDPQCGLRVAAGQREFERLTYIVLLIAKQPSPWLPLRNEAHPGKLGETHDPVAMPAQQLIMRAGLPKPLRKIGRAHV